MGSVREREGDRQTDRQTDIQAGRQTGRQTDRKTQETEIMDEENGREGGVVEKDCGENETDKNIERECLDRERAGRDSGRGNCKYHFSNLPKDHDTSMLLA